MFRITDIFLLDCQLIAHVEHLHPDGSFWFSEHYRWQGREGSKRQRMVDDEGFMLMDNGERAPLPDSLTPRDIPEAYLPDGRDWAWRDAPSMNESSILDTIRSIHQQRLITGWPQGKVDVCARTPDHKISESDRACCQIILDAFVYLRGRSYDR